MENKTGQITRYNAYVITGEGTAIGNYWIKANSPKVLNNMIKERSRGVTRDMMFHVIVFKGDFNVSATRIKQATAIAFKNKFTNTITFVDRDWQDRYLIPLAKANVGKENLVFLNPKPKAIANNSIIDRFVEEAIEEYVEENMFNVYND